jgi:hypothetical protein
MSMANKTKQTEREGDGLKERSMAHYSKGYLY